MAEDFAVVRTHPMILSYVDGLQRANVDALAFYPKQVFEREAERGRLFLGLLNGEPCGYIYVGSGSDGTMRCHQVCIQYDARRRLYGATLVSVMEEYAEKIGAHTVRLRCGFDLDANSFWKSLGYGCVRHAQGGIRRNRTINVWEKYTRPGLFEPSFIDAAEGKQDASQWRKNKQTGIVTQFSRGKSLAQYRALLISAPTLSDEAKK